MILSRVLKIPDMTELRISASISKVLYPERAKAMARFVEVVDFPSPDCTEVTAMTLILSPLS